MKLKQQPEDFQVEELTDVAAGERGDFALYRLEKRGWATPDALQIVRQRWRIEPRRLSYGGLKDRHALTTQYFTIFHGPRRKLTQNGIRVAYLGQTAAEYTSKDIRANRFQLTLRDLSPAALEAALAALTEVGLAGVPNYFDDQRFSSTAPGQEFMAHALVRGRFEDACRLALTAPYEHDRAAQKKEKAILQTHWGDWTTCKVRLPRGNTLPWLDHLVHHSDDFLGALVRLRPELRILYLSAYQSDLWNRLLAHWLRLHCAPTQLIDVPLRRGSLPMHHSLDDHQRCELANLLLPLPTARMPLEAADPRKPLLDAVLAEDGLELSQLKVKGCRELFFSKGERAALCLPTELKHEVADDELHAGKKKLILSFKLPRGSYATLIVKRITVAGNLPVDTPPG